MRVAHTRLVAALAIVSLTPTQFAATHSQVIAPAGWKTQFTVAAPQKAVPKSIPSLELPITFERRVGDLDGMKKQRLIRALVVPAVQVFSTIRASHIYKYYVAYKLTLEQASIGN